MTLSYSIEKVAYLDKVSSEFFKQEESPCQKKVKHCCKKLRKGKKERRKKPKDVGHFLVQKLRMPKQNVNCSASGKKGKLSCYKCLFE